MCFHIIVSFKGSILEGGSKLRYPDKILEPEGKIIKRERDSSIWEKNIFCERVKEIMDLDTI